MNEDPSFGPMRSPSRVLGEWANVVFVPEGLNEGSQAVYCLESSAKKIRPVGYGVNELSRGAVRSLGVRTFPGFSKRVVRTVNPR